MTSTHATLGHGASQVEPLSTGQDVLAGLEAVLEELEDDPEDDPDVEVLVEVDVELELDEEPEEDESVELDPPERESVR